MRCRRVAVSGRGSAKPCAASAARRATPELIVSIAAYGASTHRQKVGGASRRPAESGSTNAQRDRRRTHASGLERRKPLPVKGSNNRQEQKNQHPPLTDGELSGERDCLIIPVRPTRMIDRRADNLVTRLFRSCDDPVDQVAVSRSYGGICVIGPARPLGVFLSCLLSPSRRLGCCRLGG